MLTRKSACGSIHYISNMLPSSVLINEKWIIFVIIFTVRRTTLTVMHNIDNVSSVMPCWFDYASYQYRMATLYHMAIYM